MSGRVVWRSPPSLGGKFRCGVGGFVPVVKLALCDLSLQVSWCSLTTRSSDPPLWFLGPQTTCLPSDRSHATTETNV